MTNVYKIMVLTELVSSSGILRRGHLTFFILTSSSKSSNVMAIS
jgi:uncharacterized protein YaaQ